jgi:hypothetical protein
MEKVTLPGLPERRAADYQLDGFNAPRYARVIYTPQESKPDRKIIDAQAYEVDANGNFVAAPLGYPSRTPGTLHTIAMHGIGDTHTITPGWVRIVGNYDPEATAGATNALPTGTEFVETRPATGTAGAFIWWQGQLYQWQEGILDQILRGKAEELAGILRNSLASQDFEL